MNRATWTKPRAYINGMSAKEKKDLYHAAQAEYNERWSRFFHEAGLIRD